MKKGINSLFLSNVVNETLDYSPNLVISFTVKAVMAPKTVLFAFTLNLNLYHFLFTSPLLYPQYSSSDFSAAGSSLGSSFPS